MHIEAITSDCDEFAVNTILNQFPSLFQQQGILNTLLKWNVRFEREGMGKVRSFGEDSVGISNPDKSDENWPWTR